MMLRLGVNAINVWRVVLPRVRLLDNAAYQGRNNTYILCRHYMERGKEILHQATRLRRSLSSTYPYPYLPAFITNMDAQKKNFV